MDFNAIYHFLFESVEGVGVLVIGGMVLSIIAAILFEIRTRRKYRNHEVVETDEWSTFDDAEKSRKIAEIRKYKNDERIKEKNKKAAEEAAATSTNKPVRKASSAPKTTGASASSAPKTTGASTSSAPKPVRKATGPVQKESESK